MKYELHLRAPDVAVGAEVDCDDSCVVGIHEEKKHDDHDDGDEKSDGQEEMEQLMSSVSLPLALPSL